MPRILCDAREVAAGPYDSGASGAVWKLEMSQRHLDSNIIRLPPDSRIEAHAGPDLDVLLLVLDGDGELSTETGTVDLCPGALVWLPRLSRREITAGVAGLSYLTVHPRRPSLRIEASPARS
jgi:quercetin dioxygenase-like cupin family protein